MGPCRSSVLRIGSNPTEASGSGQRGGESDSLAVVVHRVTPQSRGVSLTTCQPAEYLCLIS